jgi:hypothetical protein
MQKIVRHGTLYSDFASCRHAVGSGVPPLENAVQSQELASCPIIQEYRRGS